MTAGIVSVNSKGTELKIVNCSNTGVIEGENCSAICYNEYTNDASGAEYQQRRDKGYREPDYF